MQEIVIATRNVDKFREIQEKLRGLPLNLLNLADFPSIAEVVEDQPDLYGNAIKKASEVAAQSKQWALADDTGLEVDALNGAPGVYSARYAGPDATYESNCKKLLHELRNISAEKRTARFRTVIALKTYDALYAVEGKIEGRIRVDLRGTLGFGYDPLFETISGKTLAELTILEKNNISHRASALDRMIELIKWIL